LTQNPETQDPLAFRVFNEIGIISQLATTMVEQVMPDGMTLAQFSVLNHFVRLGGEKSPVELARAFQVTKGTMTSTLQRLESHRWIEVKPDPRDGRGKRVTITATGRAARQTALTSIAPLIAEVEAAITPAAFAAALPFLTELRTHLDRRRDK
jgi:DNA-binding MarR family transcriptional regulator